MIESRFKRNERIGLLNDLCKANPHPFTPKMKKVMLSSHLWVIREKTSRLFLTKPTFFATIMLNVFKTLLIALRNTQIELFNIVVISECFRITFHNDTSIF